jgi:hypothetical protein
VLSRERRAKVEEDGEGSTTIAALGSVAAGKHSEAREARRHSAMAIGRQCEKEREETEGENGRARGGMAL